MTEIWVSCPDCRQSTAGRCSLHSSFSVSMGNQNAVAAVAAETLALWQEQDEALQRIWGALGIDGDPGSPADIAAAVEKYLDPAFSETICVECGRTVDEPQAAPARVQSDDPAQACGSATTASESSALSGSPGPQT